MEARPYSRKPASHKPRPKGGVCRSKSPGRSTCVFDHARRTWPYDPGVDWNRLVETSDRLIETLARFRNHGADAAQLLHIANEETPNWTSDASLYRLAYQALNFLEFQSIIFRDADGLIQLTKRGRRLPALSVDSWVPDPNSPAVRQWIELEELQEAADLTHAQSDITLSRLKISDWRQFREVDILFHPQLTILTGANAAGKTTLLNLLAPHFNWQGQFVTSGRHASRTLPDGLSTIGELRYSNGGRTHVFEPPVEGVSVAQAYYTDMQTVPGIFISSHRSISSYQPMETLPAKFSEADTLLDQFAAEVEARYSGGSSHYSPLFRMKEALVAAALHGYGNQAVRQTPSAVRIWEGFQGVLESFLPSDLGFRHLAVDNGDLMLMTRSGDFPLEAASGGLSAMLELSWQVFLRSQNAESFTVCIDEPENHLHPELQRLIVPSLLEAFPRVSFIVATHSPFVVTATRDCAVYALGREGDEARVSSRQVGDLNASGTADETLQSVLGLDTPLPLWVQSALSAAVEALPPDATAQDLRRLRARLSEIGLERQFPSAIAAISEAGLD